MGNKIVEWLSKITTSSHEVLPDVLLMSFTIVNAFLVGDFNSNNYVLVDTGLENSADFIIKTAEKRFGKIVSHRQLFLLMDTLTMLGR